MSAKMARNQGSNRHLGAMEALGTSVRKPFPA